MKRLFCLIALAALCGSGCASLLKNDYVIQREDGTWVFVEGQYYKLAEEGPVLGVPVDDDYIVGTHLEGMPGRYVSINGGWFRLENQ